MKCRCGCGADTGLSTKDRPERGYLKGDPLQFIKGHYVRATAKKNPKVSKGWVTKHGHEYVKLNGSSVAVHRLIAEKAIGQPLRVTARVHHHDRIPGHNDNSNLVICENQAYHALLHQRQRALIACGHASWRRCVFCKDYDDPVYLSIKPKVAPFHHICRQQYRRLHAERNSG